MRNEDYSYFPCAATTEVHIRRCYPKLYPLGLRTPNSELRTPNSEFQTPLKAKSETFHLDNIVLLDCCCRVLLLFPKPEFPHLA